MVTLHHLSAASPLAQVTTRFTAVKSFPATAVPFTVVQRTLAAPTDPPLRFTAINLTPKFCSAPPVAHDIDRVPVAARAAAPLLRLAPRKITDRAIAENTIRRECIRSPQILFDEQLRSRDVISGGQLEYCWSRLTKN